MTTQTCRTCNGAGQEYLEPPRDPQFNIAGWYPAKLKNGWQIVLYSRHCRRCDGTGATVVGRSPVPAIARQDA